MRLREKYGRAAERYGWSTSESEGQGGRHVRPTTPERSNARRPTARLYGLKVVFTLFILHGSLLTLSAQPWLESIAPGFDTVATNPVEYKKVMDKFSTAEFYLSARDCAIAYYGFAMQPSSAATIAATAPDAEAMQSAIMADDYPTAYSLGRRILDRMPMDLTALYWTLFAATETRQPWEVRNSLRGRYNSLSQIIALSGDGKSTGSAFRVVSEGDMYTFTMIELGLEIGEGYLWDERWTEFKVKPGSVTGAADRLVSTRPRFNGPTIFFERYTN